MLRLSLLLSVFLLGQITLFSQSITHNGRVLDAENSSPLPGAVVQDELSGLAVTTDADGYFSIQVGAYPITLKYRSLGFIALKSEHQGNNSVVSLEADQILLSEAVITALGLERDSKDLGYAVQKLEAKEVTEVKSVNFVDDLAGKIAGVTINQGATGVGSTSRISIRGENSFTNNNPLFVVDGIPINNNSVLNSTNEAAAGFQEVDFGNGAMDINADDIEQISVLKGPSAAALYGTRASNGVILITTKKGQANDGIGVTFNSTSSIERAFQLPEFQNSYGQGNSGQFEFVDGLGEGINDNISYSWGPALDQGLLIPQFDSPVTLPDGTIVRGGDVAVHGGLPISATPFVSNPDNLKDFYQTGSTLINNIAISSGSEKSNMRFSFTDLRSESIIPGVNLNRQNINANLEFRPIEKLVVRSSINYVHSASDNRPSSGYGSENVNYSLVAWGPRSLNIGNLEDYWQPGLQDLQQYNFNYTFFDNPYFILHENTNSFDRDRLFGNVSASYQVNEDLKVVVRTGLDNSAELREFKRAFSSNRFRNGAYAEHDVRFREQNTDILIDYNKDLGDLKWGIAVGVNRMEQRASTRQFQTLSLAQPGIFSLNNAASPIEAFEFVGRKNINSIYALAKLSYKDFLFVDLTARNDWSSALATPTSTANTSFFYPSVSAAFILNRVVDLPEVISFAKVRASWAQVGNDTNPYQTSATFASQTPVNGLPTFSADDLIPNPDLLPEKTSSVELGLDMRFFNDRLQFDVTYYNNLTENQITALPVPISSGYTGRVVNGGAVRSQGVEAIAKARAIEKEDFSWDIAMNFSRNVSTVESLPDGVERLTLAYSRVYDNENQTVWFQVEEGSRIGDMYGTGYLKNENGDFVIDADGRFIVDNNLQLLGNYNPDFILGLSNSFKFKQWDLAFLLDWRQGGELVSRTQALAGVAGQLAETGDRPEAGIVADGVVNAGTEENPVWQQNTTAVTAESYYRQFYDRNHEENNTYNASYLKLRQLAIGYTFQSGREKGLLKDDRYLRLSLIGRNLFAWSEIPHFDPEQTAVQGQQFISGVEDMSYATSRSYGFKITYSL